ncbi:MAG: hypothetical protein AB8G05_15855 [Oligoflexales bacterium]
MNSSIFSFIAAHFILFGQYGLAITQNKSIVSNTIEEKKFLEKTEEHLVKSGITDAKEEFFGSVIKNHMRAETAHETVTNLLSEASYLIKSDIIDAYANVLETKLEAKSSGIYFSRSDLSNGFVLFFSLLTKTDSTEIYYKIIHSEQAKAQVLNMKRYNTVISEIKELRKQSSKLIDMLGNGDISFEEYKSKFDELQTEMNELEDELKNL